ncbi:hypothetical protein [Streptomyces sp. NPDC002057]
MDRDENNSNRDNDRVIPIVPGQRKASQPISPKTLPNQRNRRAH